MKKNIRAVVLDVDGVVVGEKIGFNSPYPHPRVLNHLKKIREGNIPIVLCTAKPHYSVEKIILEANLNNFHITNSGGVSINPVTRELLEMHPILPSIARTTIDFFLKKQIYVELYTVENYFIQYGVNKSITELHTHILQKKPTIVSYLQNETNRADIVKIMPITRNEDEKKIITDKYLKSKMQLPLKWGIHPIALPLQFGIITEKKISKKQAMIKILRKLNILAQDTLGIGDSLSDWEFIELCGYKGAMGNASGELINLVKKNKQGHIGKSVNENGIIEIFKYFGL